MEETTASFKINKKIYKPVVSYCKDNGVKIKNFIQDALYTELVLRDRECKYVRKIKGA